MFSSVNKENKPKVQTSFKGQKSLTEQSHAKGCDINNLVKQYARSGNPFPQLTADQVQETFPIDFHTAMNIVTKQQQMFDQLPPEMRSKFNHDPQAFMNHVQDPANLEALVKEQIIAESPPAPVTEPTAAPETAPAPTPE